VEPNSKSCTEATFAGHFYNKDMKVHTWSQVKDLDHYHWLQQPMAHLCRKRQLEYIAVTMQQIFDFLGL